MNIVFAGTPEFAARHLAGLFEQNITITAVVTQPDKPGKRGKKLIPSPVKVLAEAHEIPVLQPEKFSPDDIASLEVDLLIVVAYGQILRQNLLDTPTYGCINVHGSILPRWRGAAPIQRAIEHGDPETGVCIMQMDAGLDTGPVLYEARTAIEPEDTSATLADRLVDLGVAGLCHVLQAIEAGSLEPVTQTEVGATYAKKILKSEAKICWQDSAVAVRNKIHGFNPDPICYSELDHGDQTLRVKLHKVKAVNATRNGTPGEILNVSTDGIEVATGSGTIVLELIQLPIGKGSVLTARDVLNARSDIVFPGARFH